MLAMRRESDQLFNNSNSSNPANSNDNSPVTTNSSTSNLHLHHHHHIAASSASASAASSALPSQFYPSFYNSYGLGSSSAYGGLGAFSGEILSFYSLLRSLKSPRD